MERIRGLMVWVLPALWLATPEHCPLDAASGRVWVVWCRFSVVSNAGAQSAGETTDANAPTMKVAHRRARPLLNGGGDSPYQDLLCAISAPPISVDLAASRSNAAFGLARRWQFEWRTACEPRAPSLVS